MKATQLLEIIKELKVLTNNAQIMATSKKDKYQNQLSLLEKGFADIEIQENHAEIYDALCKKGRDVIKTLKGSKDHKKNLFTLDAYIRYIKAVKGDVEGRTNNVNKYYRNFIFTSMLFFALSPQYFGFILPAIFFVPIFLGMRGVKARSINGLYMSLSVVPVAFMTSFIWIRYGIYALSNYQEAVQKVMTDTGGSLGLAKALVTVPPILGVILAILAGLQLYRGIKTRDLFV